ncbi:13167_t:CDS:2 [Acaulospora colombiana]|uniref:13167_t:CDS:1 n=1 Tax=Acaulospora colombiana TaxID=27376 RepID=A0ACA9LQR0_9GLOM|nr:13167_t:CDS:2 [Acaulospora colombiana]
MEEIESNEHNIIEERPDETIILNVGGVKVKGPTQISIKEIETELDYFQIPRPTASAIDKIAIAKVGDLIDTFKQLISKVSENYMKEASFKGFKADIDILFLGNGQATVHAGLEKTSLTDMFLATKEYAYDIMSLYKYEIKDHLENEYPELTWVHQHHSGQELPYWKIRISISWSLNHERILANVLNM